MQKKLSMVEKVVKNGILLAIVIRRNYTNEGIEFFTDDSFSQQLGYMKRPKNYTIRPHKHLEVKREVTQTQEVLFIKSGRVRIDLYGDNENLHSSLELEKGDLILLASGGHGLTMLEQTEIIEVKQGPYSGDKDKVVF
jgi:mannose-6-phosphate isomerase-like protein (cupin superfamily)